MFVGNFTPRDWVRCDGQLLAVAQFQALFSLLGTNYGGDGRTTFGVPDFRGRVVVHQGQGPGLSPYQRGMQLGQEAVGLTIPEIPSHTHGARANGSAGELGDPTGAFWASNTPYSDQAPDGQMKDGLISSAGGAVPHPNMAPFTVVPFIMATEGTYPSRS